MVFHVNSGVGCTLEGDEGRAEELPICRAHRGLIQYCKRGGHVERNKSTVCS